jgi:hypothetical protein
LRKLALAAGAAIALMGGAAAAQLVDPRTAAGAAGMIMGQPTPEAAPVAIDPSRDPTGKGVGRPTADTGLRGQPQAARPPAEPETVTTAEEEAAPVIDGEPRSLRPRPLATPPGADLGRSAVRVPGR